MDWRDVERLLIEYFAAHHVALATGDGNTDLICCSEHDGDTDGIEVSLSELARVLAPEPQLPLPRPRQDMSTWQKSDMDQWLGDDGIYEAHDFPR